MARVGVKRKEYTEANAPTCIGGSDLCDIPLPHKRYFDDPSRQREVQIRVSRYQACGGTHYYVGIRPQPNSIWHSERRVWLVADDDTEAYRDAAEKRYTNLGDVRAMIERFMAEHPHDKFVDAYGEAYNLDVALHWFYRREGD